MTSSRLLVSRWMQHVNGVTPYDYLYSEWNLTEKLLKIGLNGKHLFHRYLFAHIACSVKAQKVAWGMHVAVVFFLTILLFMSSPSLTDGWHNLFQSYFGLSRKGYNFVFWVQDVFFRFSRSLNYKERRPDNDLATPLMWCWFVAFFIRPHLDLCCYSIQAK